MTTKIAINGFGRIGRCVARILFSSPRRDLELVAINDLTTNDMLAHLLKYDSVHRTFDKDVSFDEESITIDGTRIPCFAIRDPSELPHEKLGVDIVMECTGAFRTRDGAAKHLSAGANRVIISAPGKQVDATFCVGINTDEYDPSKHQIVSNASCTTNCLAPVVKVIHESFGIEKGQMVTVHSYTNDQRILDLPHRDFRRARAAAMSMIPTTTGAAKAIALVLPALEGKLDGSAIRVPTPNVSLVNLTAKLERATSAEEVNAKVAAAAAGPLEGVLGYEETPLVSSDFIGSTFSSVFDAPSTRVVGGDLLQVQSWYDNEWGFSQRMIDLANHLAAR